MRKSQQKRRQNGSLDFQKALRSFLGYLEGTQKAAHTVKNYRWDLVAFDAFLRSRDAHSTTPIRYEALGERELNQYHDFLKAQGFRTNTRRRRLLTAHRFVRYLSNRNQLVMPLPTKLPAPHKIERIPMVVPYAELLKAVKSMTAETALELRNRALLWILAETGCLVSEIAWLKPEHIDLASGTISFVNGRSTRTLPISAELKTELMGILSATLHVPWLFTGHNRHGSLGTPISARGVELLVKHYAPKLGFPKITPKTFRQSAILFWLQEGRPAEEVKTQLGLKTLYALRGYQHMLVGTDSKSSSATTSTS